MVPRFELYVDAVSKQQKTPPKETRDLIPKTEALSFAIEVLYFQKRILAFSVASSMMSGTNGTNLSKCKVISHSRGE